MRILKNKIVFILFTMFVCLINVIDINASTSTGNNKFYTEVECHYKKKDKEIIINRKYTANGIVNTVREYDKEGELKKERDLKIAATASYDIYNNTTECPKGVDIKEVFGDFLGLFPDEIHPFDSEIEFVLASEKNYGDNIYNKLPSCQYQTGTNELRGGEHNLVFVPTFSRKETHLNKVPVTILEFDVKVKKTIYKDGEFKWVEETSVPDKNKENQYVTTCPQYAHYNPPKGIHAYALKDDRDKPKGWNKPNVLERFYDFSAQLEEMDKLYNNFKSVNDGIKVENCFQGTVGSTFSCTSYSLKNDCSEVNKIEDFRKNVMENYNKTITDFEQIVLHDNVTVGNINTDGDIALMYTDVVDKKTTILESIETDLKRKQDIIDCILEKLKNKEGITEEERREIDEVSQKVADDRARVVEERERLEVGFDVDIRSYDCETLLGGELLEWIEKAFFVVQVGSVVLVVVLGMLDFSKATVSSEADAMKKAWNNFIKRSIAVAILIILPVIIEFLLGIFDVPGLTNKNPLCK